MIPAEFAVASLLRGDHRVLVLGNGSGAAEAQRLAAALLNEGVAARSLTADATSLTAIANDYGLIQIYARQIDAMARRGDTLLVFRERGPSESLDQAVVTAKQAGVLVAFVSAGEEYVHDADTGTWNADALLHAVRQGREDVSGR